MQYFHEVISLIKKEKPDKEKLSRIKLKLCKKHRLKKIPTDIEILLKAGKQDIPKIKKFLMTKPTRSISGVAVVAVMSKPYECPHGKCSICPGGIDSYFGTVPQSYTGKEPATRRAIRNNYDPYLQVMNRLEQYVVQGHVPDKTELIIMGGTFPSFPKIYRDNFIMYSFKAMNDFSKLFFRKNELDIIKFKRFFELPGDIGSGKRERSIRKKLLQLKVIHKKDLGDEQKRNETSNIRCTGLTLETRPDFAKLRHANDMLRLGCTRVELGVQSVYDEALERVERGHTVEDSVSATRILKDLGLKVNYHMMPGLPGASYKKDLEGLRKLFSDPGFRPDMLKIYPCMVLKGTKLHDEWKKGDYAPMNTKKAASLIAEFKRYVPEYVRIMRVQRDIPTFMTEAGVDRTNLRQYVKNTLEDKGIKCRCIRCREIGRSGGKIKGYKIKAVSYCASKGREFFISAEKNDMVIGFCRLRFPSAALRDEITQDSALVRELHVYGEAVSLGSKGEIQHKGIGKRLLLEAEKLSKKNGKKKIAVISGIGARNYYRKSGYIREGVYMIKRLTPYTFIF
ncbi:tRNA uridine(34) 5-carboxymethylaminomethyl modification radical SAM/GNAT enzyme Elp3 [Candidatus Woesearchaeota archaeon]|nr:tRNA uridine(34) 5-carboxymethylaminomethyl modification radical SAM/GNAT enzyme Elp3 [Candidatus Woesearchaeota archaeon]